MVPNKKASELLEPLTLVGWGWVRGQLQLVTSVLARSLRRSRWRRSQSSLWCSLHPPPPQHPHTGLSSPNICLVTLPVLEARTPECCWGP